MSTAADPRPFAGEAQACVVLPAGTDPETRGLRELLVRERFELEVELGAPVTFRVAGACGPNRDLGDPHASDGADELDARETHDDGSRAGGAMASVYVGPAAQNAELARLRSASGLDDVPRPYVELGDGVVVLDVPDGPDSVEAAFSLLRTAVRGGADPGGDGPDVRAHRSAAPTVPAPGIVRVERAPVSGPAEALERLVDEIGWTYPSFGLRGIDWPRLAGEWRAEAERGDTSLDVMQRWVAGLRDPHTAVRAVAARGFLPYQAVVGDESVRLAHVPRWSAGWAAGARAGDVVVAVDRPLDPQALLAVSAGEERTRRWFAGRRAMTVVPPGDVVVEFQDGSGRRRRWTERATGRPWAEPVSWTRLPSGTGYLRVRAWLPDADWADTVDSAFAELAGCPRMIVDVRGNVGGSLVAAQWFRDRFLAGRATLGSVRFSVGDGTLSPPSPIESEPAGGRRWNRPVRFLLDRLSYSATEDALLGLRDLDHVQFYGEPSGGGSGRPRSVQLQDGFALSISTALTYERSGRCVEGQGLAVDVALPGVAVRSGDAVRLADASW